jgi:hypothetical protein
MKLSDQAVLTMALALQKSLVLEIDYGNLLKEFDFELNKVGELSIANFEVARLSKEEFEKSFENLED